MSSQGQTGATTGTQGRGEEATALAPLEDARNPGRPLDLDWVMSVQANTSAIERRCASLPGRRTVKKE